MFLFLQKIIMAKVNILSIIVCYKLHIIDYLLFFFSMGYTGKVLQGQQSGQVLFAVSALRYQTCFCLILLRLSAFFHSFF